MLVTTGGPMHIRVQPTRDYLEVQQAVGEINFMRSSGNALIGSVQEVLTDISVPSSAASR
jgi:hypothetical protein